MKTIADQNDEIAAQVERELPTPCHGFASCDERDEHRQKQDARFLVLCQETSVDDAATPKAYVAIMDDSGGGAAYGVGETEDEARVDAAKWGFDSGMAVRITRESYTRIMAGNPDAVYRVVRMCR